MEMDELARDDLVGRGVVFLFVDAGDLCTCHFAEKSSKDAERDWR